MLQTSKLDQVLESIEMLPVEDQEMLAELLRKRLIERRRDEIAKTIAQTQKDYKEGNIFRGSVEEVIAELNR
ncbi:MAG: hypothetical protein DCF15_16935 [Phormidesmis priestleyi]|uniref:Addiction module protein n=1 Tax=Phormidesmis priestleyi TaxID=268141 RepID=A0A2W4YQW3_9CYAN|nr:MAG: hypothetical protein DCF15_16935 [Phormidesmis priestleyi]